MESVKTTQLCMVTKVLSWNYTTTQMEGKAKQIEKGLS